MSKPCVFFDRDGIVNRSPGPGYVERLEDFFLLPDFLRSMQVVKQKGYVSVLITNQRGVSRGCLTQETLDSIHHWMQAELERDGLGFLALYACTAMDDAHPMRKPNPGMILEAARTHDLSLSDSWMIGDSETDVLAGQRAGCRSVLVAPGGPESVATHVVPGMASLPGFLREHLPLAYH